MTSLYAIAEGGLRPVVRSAFGNESPIGKWVEADPKISRPRCDDHWAAGVVVFRDA